MTIMRTENLTEEYLNRNQLKTECLHKQITLERDIWNKSYSGNEQYEKGVSEKGA